MEKMYSVPYLVAWMDRGINVKPGEIPKHACME